MLLTMYQEHTGEKEPRSRVNSAMVKLLGELRWDHQSDEVTMQVLDLIRRALRKPKSVGIGVPRRIRPENAVSTEPTAFAEDWPLHPPDGACSSCSSS